MRKSWLIILFVLVVSIVSVHASYPAPPRCIFTSEIDCVDFYVNPGANYLNFSFSNNLNESADFSFKAWTEDNISAITCLCNGAASCNVQKGRQGNVMCTFPQGVIPSQREMLFFDFEGGYLFAHNPENVTKIRGSLYTKPYTHLFSAYYSRGIVGYIISVGLLTLFIFMIIWLGKLNKKKTSVNSGLRVFFIALTFLFVFLFVLVNISEILLFGFSLRNSWWLIGGIIYALLLSLIPAILVGIIVGIVSHFRNKKKSTKK